MQASQPARELDRAGKGTFGARFVVIELGDIMDIPIKEERRKNLNACVVTRTTEENIAESLPRGQVVAPVDPGNQKHRIEAAIAQDTLEAE